MSPISLAPAGTFDPEFSRCSRWNSGRHHPKPQTRNRPFVLPCFNRSLEPPSNRSVMTRPRTCSTTAVGFRGIVEMFRYQPEMSDIQVAHRFDPGRFVKNRGIVAYVGVDEYRRAIIRSVGFREFALTRLQVGEDFKAFVAACTTHRSSESTRSRRREAPPRFEDHRAPGRRLRVRFWTRSSRERSRASSLTLIAEVSLQSPRFHCLGRTIDLRQRLKS